MGNNNCPLIICSFLLIMGLLFIPNCLAARKLADIPQNNGAGGVNNENHHQSKSGVHGSVSSRGGSATGDNAPSGVVKMPPPTSYQRIINSDNNGVQSITGTGNGNGVIASNNGKGDQTVINNGNGDQSITTNDGNGKQTVISNGNGVQSITSNNGSGDQTVLENGNGVQSISKNKGNGNQNVKNNGIGVQSIATNGGNGDQNVENNGNGVQSIATNSGNGDQTVENNGNGSRSIATNGSNSNGGGQQKYQESSPPEYESNPSPYRQQNFFSAPEYENENSVTYP